MNSETAQKNCYPDRSGAKASEVEGPAFFGSAWNRPLHLFLRSPAALCLLALLTFSAACNRAPSQPSPANPQSAAKRYPFKGKVISVDKKSGTANVNNEPIPGFMDSMVMPYPIKSAAALDQLQPGDSITADVVVAEPGNYWLENVKVTSRKKITADAKPVASGDRARKSNERNC